MNVPTGTWSFPQNAKRPYLKFRLGTYVLLAPNSQPHDDVVSDKVYKCAGCVTLVENMK